MTSKSGRDEELGLGGSGQKKRTATNREKEPGQRGRPER
jgi:hypothetical protein